MSVNASHCEFGWRAEDFNLISVDDSKHTLQSLKGNKGTVIVFICNHCPYAVSYKHLTLPTICSL